MLPKAQKILKGLKTTEEKQIFIQKYYAKFWWDVINDGLLHIQTKTGEIIKLYPNPTQKRLLKLIVDQWKADKPIRLLIPKARQLGVSTLIEAVIIAVTCFVGQKKALIIADEGKKSTNIFNMSKLMYDRLSDVIKPEKKESNAKVLAFEGKDSRIDIDTAENKDAGRSGNWQIAHLSEIDYYRDAEYLMSGLSSCIAKIPQTMIFMESTGNGVGSYFHSMIQKSLRGENDYTVFFISWFESPEYSTPLLDGETLELSRTGKYGDEVYYYETYNLTLEQMKWRRESIRNEFNYNLRKQMQEYPSCFTADTRVSFPDKSGIYTFCNMPECYKGENDVYGIKTKLGYSIKATKNHKFKKENGEWCQLQDLRVGDEIKLLQPNFSDKYQYVELKYNLPVMNHKIKIDEELAEFIGLFMGDGSFGKDKTGSCYWMSFCFDAKDTDVIEKYEKYFTKTFGTINKRIVGDKNGGVELRMSSKWLDVFFVSLGLTTRQTIYEKKKSGIKRNICVPDYIFNSPKSVVSAFLRGLFDADGYIGYKCPMVKFFTKYEKFMLDVQVLLLGFGITSRMAVVKKKNGCGREYTGRELVLRKLETQKYMEEIGFISNRKNNKWKNRKINTNRDTSSIQIKMIDTIDRVSYCGVESVYDREVKPEHYYSANGLFAHNSIEESFIASGQPVFDRQLLEEISKLYTMEHDITATVVEKKLVISDNGYIKIWHKPKYGMNNRYAIFADTGGLWYENDKNCADYSCAVVYDRIERKVVCTIHGHFEALHYAQILVSTAEYYDNAKLAIEINKYASETDEQGVTVLDNIKEKIKYRNFYTREVYDDTIKKTTTKIGFHTNRDTKQMIVNRLYSFVHNYKEEDIHVNNEQIINEMRTYIITQTKTGKTSWNAQDGYKDDYVISFGGVLVVSDQMPNPSPKEVYEEEVDDEELGLL